MPTEISIKESGKEERLMDKAPLLILMDICTRDGGSMMSIMDREPRPGTTDPSSTMENLMRAKKQAREDLSLMATTMRVILQMVNSKDKEPISLLIVVKFIKESSKRITLLDMGK